MELIDSHCHLDALNYQTEHQNMADVLAKAAQQQVTQCLAIGTTLASSQYLLDSLVDYPQVFIACGIHPLHVKDSTENDLTLLNDLIDSKRIVGVGETGLDYFYQKDTVLQQQHYFREHIRMAQQANKPIIVHTRDAREDTLAILREMQAEKNGGVLHCFTEDEKTASRLLDMGFFISFSGIVTFKSAEAIRQVARFVPLDRILVETDSPYLAPVPYRGKENQPAYVRIVAEYLAALKGVSLEKLAEATTANFHRLFKTKRFSN